MYIIFYLYINLFLLTECCFTEYCSIKYTQSILKYLFIDKSKYTHEQAK